MDMDFPFLSQDSSFGDVALVLSHIQYKTRTIPIINEETLELIGSLQSANLRGYLVKAGKKHIQGIHPKTPMLRTSLKNFFSLLPENEHIIIPEDMKQLFMIKLEDEGFWDRKIDIYDKILCPDLSPFTIQDNISVPRAHYLFSMLGLQTVFVLSRGKLVGMMSIPNFQDIKYNDIKDELKEESKEDKSKIIYKKSESLLLGGLSDIRGHNYNRKETL